MLGHPSLGLISRDTRDFLARIPEHRLPVCSSSRLFICIARTKKTRAQLLEQTRVTLISFHDA